MPNIEHPYVGLTGGRWLKGNLHSHTTVSDGERTHQEVIDDYASRGYGFLMISDHDVYTSKEELEAFDSRLVKRPQILVANKIDLLDKDKQRIDKVKSLARKENIPFFAISALKKEGIKELILAMAKGLDIQSLQEKKP